MVSFSFRNQLSFKTSFVHRRHHHHLNVSTETDSFRLITETLFGESRERERKRKREKERELLIKKPFVTVTQRSLPLKNANGRCSHSV
jgi:hypothetical protein